MSVCITNEIRDIRSCTIVGQHTDFCDGWAYRWDIDLSRAPGDELREWRRVPVTRSVWSPVLKRYTDIAVECAGCLPHEAEHGLLCWSCWEKTLDAIRSATDMITHLRSVPRAQQMDNAGVRGSATWVVPVPLTWRMADELIMLAGHPAPGFPSDAGVFEVEAIAERYIDGLDADEWVRHPHGAEDAVRFYLLMQAAMAQHPMAEYEHRVKNVRCYRCGQRSLLWKPPLAFEGDVHVTCTNPKCGAELDQTLYEHVALVEDQISKERKKPAAPDAEVAS